MASCKRCGEKAGMLKDVCDSCAPVLQREEDERQRVAKEQMREAERQQAQAHADHIAGLVNQWKVTAEQSFAQGRKVYLYATEYVSVDSTWSSGGELATFDMDNLTARGLSGWQIVSVIPRTHGIALTNTSSGSTWGETWGAGLGGNVIGAYVLLAKEISSFDDSLETEVALQVADQLIESGVQL